METSENWRGHATSRAPFQTVVATQEGGAGISSLPAEQLQGDNTTAHYKRKNE